jgi:hypothetical protein
MTYDVLRDARNTVEIAEWRMARKAQAPDWDEAKAQALIIVAYAPVIVFVFAHILKFWRALLGLPRGRSF